MNFEKTKFYFKEYLSFSKTERNGIIVMLSLIIIVLSMRLLSPLLFHPDPTIDHRKFDQEIAQFEKLCDSTDRSKTVVNKNTTQIHLHPSSNTKGPIEKIEINSADSAALDRLPGIGPVLAQRILKYRRILGGFYAFNQLSEVYGLKPETISKIEKYIKIDTAKIEKIAINNDSFKKVNAHPYISYEQTKAIFKLRSSQKIESITQLKNAGIFSEEEIKKITPYLVMY